MNLRSINAKPGYQNKDFRLPKNFDDIYFIEIVELITQQIRKMESKQNQSHPHQKLMRSDLQKKLVKGTLRNRAYRLFETLRKLPDDCAMHIDHQCILFKTEQIRNANTF